MSFYCNRLYLFLDGELGSVDEENFRHHLACCEPCACGLHDAMQLERLGLCSLCDRDMAAQAGAVPVDLVREWNRRWWLPRGRWPVTATLALAAWLAALAVFAPPSREVPQELWLAQTSTRLLEARVAYGRADSHRPYAPMRGGTATPSATSPLSLRAMADLEDQGDLHGIAAAYLVRKDLRQASDFLARAPPSPDRDCDQAVIALEQGRHEEALALLEGALRQRPEHPQALWNRALVLREMGLTLLAAEAFEAVVKQREPGWSEEALIRARALRQETQARGRAWSGLAVKRLTSRGAPLR